MNNETFRMELDTSQVIKIEKQWRHSYTFRILDEGLEPTVTRNLVLDFTGYENTYFAYIFTYDLTEEEKIGLYNGENNGNLPNQLQIYTPEYETQSIDGDCFQSILVPGSNCTCGGNHYFGQVDEECTCPVGERAEPPRLVLVSVPCGTPPGAGTGLSYTWSISLAGGDGNGDGNHTYPGSRDEGPDDGPIDDLDDSLNGLETVPVLDPPEEPDDPEEGDPCEELNNMSKEKPYLNILENKTSEDKEYGYYYNGDPGAKTAPHYDDLPWKLDIPTGGTIYGCSHTHPDPDSTPSIPMFSIEDIMWLGYAYVYHNFPKPPPDKFFITMTIKNGGVPIHFAIKIEDIAQYMGSHTSYNNLSTSDRGNLEWQLSRIYTKRKKNGGGHLGYARDLYTFLSEKGIKGFSVYKSDEDLNNWSKLDYDSANNEITEIPCN